VLCDFALVLENWFCILRARVYQSSRWCIKLTSMAQVGKSVYIRSSGKMNRRKSLENNSRNLYQKAAIQGGSGESAMPRGRTRILPTAWSGP